MSFGEAETIDEDERIAREYIKSLIREGKAKDIMDAYSSHMQSCYYVHDIIMSVAYDESLHMAEGVKAFARNLLDDWSK